MMIILPLLLALTAGAHVTRVPASAVRPVPMLRPAVSGPAATLTATLAAPAEAPSPLPAPAFAPDREAALVAKLAAKLPAQDTAARGKTADWIRDIAVENPRAVVQSAAVGALAAYAETSGSLGDFESASARVESIVASTPYDSVFEDAVAWLVEAARRSGRAQRAHALLVAERLGRAGSAERREKAAALIETLKGAPGFRLDEDDLSRAAARVRAGR